jgi:uncharacterized membrane protein YgaE (UPF0421/DUF939 family)
MARLLADGTGIELAWRDEAERARRRVRESLWPAVHTSLAAALAWLIAHRGLGHPQPFFAPIAAAIALSSSHTQRSRRIVQMVVGVLLGIAISVALTQVIGTGTVALGVIVFVTVVAALLAGAGFVGEGMMFVNQAAASAILVVALHKHGTGAERALDAVVGGGVALVVGVLLFPAQPLPRLRGAEREVLEGLGGALGHVAGLLRTGEAAEPGWTLAAGYDIHERLARLARVRAMARANVRIAPRRWHLRPAVYAEDERVARLDLLANAVLSLVRAVDPQSYEPASVPAELRTHIEALAAAMDALAVAPQPWPPEVLAAATGAADAAIGHVSAAPVDRGPVIASILRATARDLRAVVDPPEAGTDLPNAPEGVRGA